MSPAILEGGGTRASWGTRDRVIAVFRCMMDGQYARVGELLNALPTDDNGGVVGNIDTDSGRPVLMVMCEAQRRPGIVFYQSAAHMSPDNGEAKRVKIELERIQAELDALHAKKQRARR